jgi:hypothetical protein
VLVDGRKCSIPYDAAKTSYMGSKACTMYTDKKEKKIFLIYKEIQKVSVAKSYMTNGLVIYD